MINDIIIKIFRRVGYQFAKLKPISFEETLQLCKRSKDIISRISPNFTILQGPFAGIRYPNLDITEAAVVPKIVGFYESQLHPFIKKIIETGYSDIINIGSAEGYYAIGFAKRMPQATIHCFEINTKDIEFCKLMAKANHVSNITYNNFCSSNTLLNFLPTGKMLVFCDCEGYELELFTPQVVGKLKNADFLIELHDISNSKISTILINRFRKTHYIEVVNNRNADLKKFFAMLNQLSKDEKSFALSEHRGGYKKNCFMEWVFMKAF